MLNLTESAVELMLQTIIPVFMQMMVLFLILAMGYVAGKTKVMTIDGNKNLSLLVNNITNPCNILYSALCTDHALSNREVIELIGIAVAMYILLIACAQLIPRLLKVPRDQTGQYKFMMIFSNVGYMGIPVVAAIFGQEAVFCVSIFVMVFYVFIYTYGIYLICGGGLDGRFQWRSLLSPMMVSSFAGIICYLCNIRVTGVLEATLDMVRMVTTPCAMLIIGCALSTISLKTVFFNWRLYIVALLKLLVIPCAAYICLKPIITNSIVLGAMVTIMAMPIASNFTMLSAQYDRDQKLAASSVFITTLLSVLTIPLLAGILNPA